MLDILLLAIVLNLDSLSSAFAMGFRRFSVSRAFSYALCSAIAGGMATAAGFLLGQAAKNFSVSDAHWIAFALLLVVGAHMCWEATHPGDELKGTLQPPEVHGFARILFVSLATSIDNLGVGISLGLAGASIAIDSLAIGCGAFIATCLGLFLARRMPMILETRLEMAGGIVVILIGFKMILP
jgi:putative Mn2+ efflux pump MntP